MVYLPKTDRSHAAGDVVAMHTLLVSSRYTGAGWCEYGGVEEWLLARAFSISSHTRSSGFVAIIERFCLLREGRLARLSKDLWLQKRFLVHVPAHLSPNHVPESSSCISSCPPPSTMGPCRDCRASKLRRDSRSSSGECNRNHWIPRLRIFFLRTNSFLFFFIENAELFPLRLVLTTWLAYRA